MFHDEIILLVGTTGVLICFSLEHVARKFI